MTSPNSDTRLDGWQPIETAPDDALFIGAVHVRDNRTGVRWWDRHLLSLDDETGDIHADYDHGWQLADYEWWHPLDLPPIPTPPPVSEEKS